VICGPAQARPIADALPNAELVMIAGCGHMPAIEAPDRLRAAVIEWLKS
jgi:pimeloyl-ACP methyl ester carboxylesterase